ncbi:MAG: creatininase family protein [Actinobacteria bacterium]|nr:creatininase family protein [Actinomycetota bacterium]
MKALRLADLTMPELAEKISAIELAIIPVGSTEQHGPHMVYGTDAICAERLSERIAEVVGPRAVVLPGLPWGLSEHHMNFPGSITLRSATMHAVIHDLVLSWVRHGVKKFLLVNGHGGNLSALTAIAVEVGHDVGAQLAILHWESIARDVIQKLAKTPVYGHACEIEASLLWYLHPEAVRVAALTPGQVQPPRYRWGGGFGLPMQPLAVLLSKKVEETTLNGALGDATQASPEIGREITDVIVQRTAEFLSDFLGV